MGNAEKEVTQQMVENNDNHALDENNDTQVGRVVKRKRILITVAIIAVVLIVVLVRRTVLFNAAIDSYREAVKNYNTTVEQFNSAANDYNAKVQPIAEYNENLQLALEAANYAIESEDPLFDESLRQELQGLINEAEQKAVEGFSIVSEKDSIDADSFLEQASLGREQITEEAQGVLNKDASLKGEIEQLRDKETELPIISQSDTLPTDLFNCAGAFIDSIEIQRQITQPTEAWVKERLKNIESITGMQEVTPDHDPNRHLGQEGWYTACVYFSVDSIDQSAIEGDDIVDKGTVAGGAIEVFETAEDAEARDNYLTDFDNTLLQPGSHYVLGTMVVRTSRRLEAEAQIELTDTIVGEFIRLE